MRNLHKDPHFGWSHQNGWKTWCRIPTATLTPSTVSMMSGDDRCFVCGRTGHFGCHSPDAPSYSYYEFGQFEQDCLNKILPLGTQCHQDRSHSRNRYTHTQRDRSHSTFYGPRHGTQLIRSQSCHHSHCDRRSSFIRHTSHSSSSHHNSLFHPSADRHPHHHSHHDPNWHSHAPSYTCHFSCRHHSCHSTDWI